MDYYIEKENLLTFSYKNVTSSSFSLYLTDVEGINNSFERDIELIEVKGRDGEILLNNNRRKSKDITLKGFIDVDSAYVKDIDILSSEVENWLQGEVGYNALTFSDSKKTHEAICIGSIRILETIKGFAEVEIKFKIKPV